MKSQIKIRQRGCRNSQREKLTMIEKNKHSNLLEQHQYRYSLQDIPNPNLYREIYPYTEIPKVAFNHRHVPIRMPKEI